MKNLNLLFLIFAVIQVNLNFAALTDSGTKKFTAHEIFQKSQKHAKEVEINKKQQQLIQAINLGNIKAVNTLLSENVDPESIDNNNQKTALEIAQGLLEQSAGGNLTKRKEIVDILKKAVAQKKPEFKKESLEEGFEIISREKSKLFKLIEKLNSDVINNKISEEVLNQKADELRTDIIEELENFTAEDLRQAIELAQKYSLEYQNKIKKNMTTLEWTKWLYYGDPVTNFWNKIITTLNSYKA